MTAPSIDWDALRTVATEAAQNAWAPYSGLRVGAAAITDDGRVVTGCNVENASYGLTLCAECSLVSDLHRQGGGKLVAVVAVDGAGATLMPCGRCRQLLSEFAAGGLLVGAVTGPIPLDELLPSAFGSNDLPEASTQRQGR